MDDVLAKSTKLVHDEKRHKYMQILTLAVGLHYPIVLFHEYNIRTDSLLVTTSHHHGDLDYTFNMGTGAAGPQLPHWEILRKFLLANIFRLLLS